jgi:outer membrane protein assembly factor BamB
MAALRRIEPVAAPTSTTMPKPLPVSIVVLLLSCAMLRSTSRAAPPSPYRPPASVPEAGIGFRGDGRGIFPDSRPPTQWDEATGKNIRWKAPLPNFGYACPVPVGNRVFMMTEPGWKSVWPQLSCFDADTGQLVWRRDVDPLLAFDDLSAARRKELADDVAWVQELWRVAYRETGAIAAKGGAEPGSPEVAKANETLARHGMSIEGVRLNYGQLRSLRYSGETQARLKAVGQKMRPYGITTTCTWNNSGQARIGFCFPTPVSDGRSIYVTTLHGTVACYDMDGQLKWTRWSGYSQGGNSGLTPSPRLWGNLLLTPFYDWSNNKLIAWNKATGQKLWAAEVPKAPEPFENRTSRPHASPIIMKLQSTAVAVTGTGHVVRLPDGRVYDAKVGTPEVGTVAVDDEGDRIYYSTSGDSYRGVRIGLKLQLTGDDLKVDKLFGLASGGQQSSPIFAGGKVILSLAQMDPASGHFLGLPAAEAANVTDARRAPQMAPQTRHVLLCAGTYLYGLHDARPKGKDSGGIGEVYTLDGKKVASNTLLVPKLEGEKIDQWQQQGFGNSFSYACPMNIGGDRLYIASKDFLYCIAAGQ